MHKFARQLITEWRRLDMPVEAGTVVVAVSGGADSMSLLLAVHDLTARQKLMHRLVVAHLNHGIRGEEADADAAFVRGIAARLDVEVICEKAKLTRRGNLEQQARETRYEFLDRVAEREGAFAILTGHTMDDQAETFLMNLIRGSGPDGLSGMPAQRGKIVRPLLSWCRRADTEEFCRLYGIDFRQDPMNDDAAFRRVRIRRDLIPLLAEMNPKIVETLTAAAGLMRAGQVGGIDVEALSIEQLRAIDHPQRLDTIRSWLRHHRGNTRLLGLKHIQAVERLAMSEKSGRFVELPGKATVTRAGGCLNYRTELG